MMTNGGFAIRLAPMGVIAALLAMTGCLGQGGRVTTTVHHMGERVQVGPLIYTILDVEWRSQTGSSDSPVVPQGKFALIRLSITNAGSREISVPLLEIEDAKGSTFQETTEAKGVDEWLGYLREVRPAETIHGRIVFDLQPGEYRLRVSSGGPPDSERIALVGIPLRFEESAPLPVQGPGVPDAPIEPPTQP
jgi:hypothetical protein